MDNYNASDLKPIGGGGNGTIFLTPKDTVIKAIKGQSNCYEAAKQKDKQNQVVASIERLKSIPSDDSLIQLIKKYVTVSRALSYSTNSFTINGENYNCYFEMDRLYGIPLSVYREFDASVDDNIDKKYLASVGNDFNVMVQLMFSSENPAKIYNHDTSSPMSSTNPTRGYAISKYDTRFLDFLRITRNLQISDDEFKRVIGFIYGWLYYDAKIIAQDVEFTLGFDPTLLQFRINILDFDQIVDEPNVDSIIPDIFDYDVYMDVDDKIFQDAWKFAKSMSDNLRQTNQSGQTGGRTGKYYKKYMKYKYKYDSLRNRKGY